MTKIKILAVITALLPSLIVFSQARLIDVPEWFFDATNYNSNSLAIGISDIDLNETQAYKQAKERALLNFSIMHHSKFSSLTTSGTGNQQTSMYAAEGTEYVLYSAFITGKLLQFENITTVDSFYTLNKEAIILLKLEEPSTDSIETTFEISRRAGFQNNDQNLPFFVDELSLKLNSNDTTCYQSDIYKDQNLVVNAKKKQDVNFFDDVSNTRKWYQYKNYDSKNNSSLPCNLNLGLWNAYIFNLIDQICIYNSFENDLLHKLSTTNLGVLNKYAGSETFTQFVYSLKNLQTIETDTKIDKIGIAENKLQIAIKNTGKDESLPYPTNLSRKEKKELKKMQAENWQFIGNQYIESAWFAAMHILNTRDDCMISTREIRSNDLNAAILEGIHLAKLDLSSQFESKVSALNNMESVNDDQIQVQSAKLLNVMKSEKINTRYIFYRKINPISFEVKIFLVYKMN